MDLDTASEMYRRMFRSRSFELAAIEKLRTGKIPGALHTSVGQEASIVGSCLALRDDDYMVGNHRSHGRPVAALGAKMQGTGRVALCFFAGTNGCVTPRSPRPGSPARRRAPPWSACGRSRAVVLSLAGHPNLNARITGDQIRLATSICLGIGIDTADGLVVGVLRDAGGLGLAELAAEAKAIAERIRAGHADVADLAGSTFTISNLGAFGIDTFTPIINPPEVAILGAERLADPDTLMRRNE